MTGLMLKDFFLVRKSILYIVVITLAFGVAYSGSSAAFSVVGAMGTVMTASLTSTTLSYDEFYHWDRYAAALPISRRRVVGAKYLFLLALTLGVGLLSLLEGALFGALLGDGVLWEELLATVAASLSVGLLGAAVVLPLYYRFGVQQCRFALAAVYGIPALAVVLWARATGFSFGEAQAEGLLRLLAAAPFLALAAVGVSWLISTRICQKKELK